MGIKIDTQQLFCINNIMWTLSNIASYSYGYSEIDYSLVPSIS